MMRIALINSNQIKPPIAPIGLEYVAEAVHGSGHEIKVLDLCWVDETQSALKRFFKNSSFELIGITLRNTDDCGFLSHQSFLKEFADMVATIRRHTDGFIAVGGVGFSTMPIAVLESCQADVGIWGDGEFMLPELASRLEKNTDWCELPNLVWNQGDGWIKNTSGDWPLENLPTMTRRWVDNVRYFREGGQAGFETKRGCSRNCIYCADPVAKGKRIRLRPPKAVTDEIENLVEQGIDHFHTCDSEFNFPEWHAKEVCREMMRRHLNEKIRWYAYCSPVPFSPELAGLMKGAGCVGINFGVDNGDADILSRLGRDHTPEDIATVAHLCKNQDLVTMFDLLLGSPEESQGSLRRTVELMKSTSPDRVGVSVGVRVYPGTEISERVKNPELHLGLVGGSSPFEPLFYLDPQISTQVFDLLDRLIGADERFFFFDPTKPNKNYNYNANQVLVDAIRDGFRGAYWDILRRCADQL